MDIQRFFNQPQSVSENGDRECENEGCSEAQTSEEIDSSREVNISRSREANVSHPIDIAIRQRSSQESEPAGDLGIDQPNQVVIKNYPSRLFSGEKISFHSAWYTHRNWLEYSVNADIVYCYPC